MTPALSPLPDPSRIRQTMAGADFADCYQFDDLWPEQNALQTYLTLMGRTPAWMNGLMAMRNQLVRLVGLKHLGQLAPLDSLAGASSCPIGQRLGIFSLASQSPDEVIVLDDDKHLRVQLSLLKHTVQGRARVSLSTVVHIHNRLGRLYMAVVGPAHQLIVPRLLAQVAHA